MYRFFYFFPEYCHSFFSALKNKKWFFLSVFFVFLSCLLLFSFGEKNNFFADLSVPYASSDAGLELEVTNTEIVSEQAPDDGAQALILILTYIFTLLKYILGILVIFWIVWAGVYIVAGSADEERVKSGKNMIKYSIFGLVTMLLVEPFVLNIFYGGGSGGISYVKSGIGDIQTSTDNFRTEVKGVMDFVKTLLIFIAMGYIIKAGSQLIFSYGDEEKVSGVKNMALPMFFGLLLIIFNEVFIDQVLYKVVLSESGESVDFESVQGNEGVSIFVEQIVGFLSYIFYFLITVLLVFILYSGGTLLFSFGEEEKVQKSKTILINAAIGMVILVVSYLLLESLVYFS